MRLPIRDVPAVLQQQSQRLPEYATLALGVLKIMKIRITSASLPRLAKVLARLGIPAAAVHEGVTHVQATGAVAAITVRISRTASSLPGYAADLWTGADAGKVEA